MKNQNPFSKVTGSVQRFFISLSLPATPTEESDNPSMMEQALAHKAEREAKIKELDAQGVVYCPRCLSTQITAQQKGFGAGKALVGASLIGPVGLAAGALGSKKVERICLNCKHKF